jgi:hypothetical protein
VGFGRRSLAEGLQLFALFGLAVAAPSLGLLGRSPGFLVAHRMNRAELWLLFGALVLLLPLATWLVEYALGALSARLAGAVHLLLAAALALDLYLVTGRATAPRFHPARVEFGDFVLRPLAIRR